jgi:DNA-binding transcriptional MocR family regulator
MHHIADGRTPARAPPPAAGPRRKRGLTPTACSWTPERRQVLADILASYPDGWIIEDDHFAEASCSMPGSLHSNPQLQDRVVYVRSFSKSVSPDLRLSVAVARPPIRNPLTMARSFSDGWTSKLSRRVLAEVLTDPGTDQAMERARSEYARRREAMRDGLLEASLADGLGLTVPTLGPDGIHIWITFRLAVTPGASWRPCRGAAFYSPADNHSSPPREPSHLRINAGLLSVDIVPAVASAVCEAVTSTLGEPTALLTP